MKHLWLSLGFALLAACSNSDHGKNVIANAPDPQDPAAARPDPVARPAPAPAPSAPAKAAPVEPDPNNGSDVDRARNQAMIDGRDKDVLRFCEMEKLDDKSNPQALLGCTLAACRIKDEATAQRYSKPLAKAYLDQARRVCATNQIAI